MAEFKMPKLGADMTAGTLIEWLKNPGDQIRRGDIIAEVDTDKGVIEVEVFVDGVIEKLLINTGEQVPVGTVLALIKENEPNGKDSSEKIEKPKTDVPEKRLLVSPSARKLARKLGVDLERVTGSGHGGRIQRKDVEEAAGDKKEEAGVKSSTARPKTDPERFARMRQSIAAAMTRSKKEIPHYYLGTKIDLTRVIEWLDRENKEKPLKNRILYSVLLIKAVALALEKMPEFNGSWENGQLRINEKINVGTAVSLRQGGLVAPALPDTNKQNLGELMKNLRDLVNRTRAGTLRSSELSDSTITVTNLGEQSVETVFGIIYPPQVAIVGFGKIYEDVSVINGRIKGCYKINASLSADHRASDGHRGALFLAAIEKLLQEPEKL
jgi:pyruvate dehydrogenase E2 component (dihydrolipoamide acetyltransferase)